LYSLAVKHNDDSRYHCYILYNLTYKSIKLDISTDIQSITLEIHNDNNSTCRLVLAEVALFIFGQKDDFVVIFGQKSKFTLGPSLISTNVIRR